MKIKQLSPILASQIAAGEVVERPASVFKELVENSLDAGSTKIDIAVERGGVKLVKIRDDGEGILKEDLPLSLVQHATSKIAAVQDLACINSLGFRGEALASISAVSKIEVISKPAQQEQAWKLSNASLELEPAAHIDGTTVQVKDLFYNVPARRKFLRSERTEYIHLEEVFKRIALSHLNVSFSWSNNGKQIYELPACKNDVAIERRLNKICGERMLNNSVYIDIEQNGLRLWGWLGAPQDARATAELQYFYVNQRMVRDRMINHAIRQGYQEYLPAGRYATYCLYLEIDPASIDVNVHPTKHEIRFRESRVAHAFLVAAISQGLQQGLIKEFQQETQAESYNTLVYQTQAEKFNSQEYQIQAKTLAQLDKCYQQPWGNKFHFKAKHPADNFSLKVDNVATATNVGSETVANISSKASINSDTTILAILEKNKFILAKCEDEFVILDVMKTKLKCLQFEAKTALAKADKVASFNLTLPMAVTLEAALVEGIMLQKREFAKLGFAVEQLGEQQLLVKSIPKILKGCEIAYTEFFPVALKAFNKAGNILQENLALVIAALSATMSCESELFEQEAIDLVNKSRAFAKTFKIEELSQFITE